MFQIQQHLMGPVEVIGQIGYLLIESFEGVAYNSPG
jgi:hypothetical protein